MEKNVLSKKMRTHPAGVAGGHGRRFVVYLIREAPLTRGFAACTIRGQPKKVDRSTKFHFTDKR